MAGSTADGPSESNGIDNVTISKACSTDNGMKTSHEANCEAGGEGKSRVYHFDAIIVEDDDDISLEDEFATFRRFLARGMKALGIENPI
jgi:hypothetical protein